MAKNDLFAFDFDDSNNSTRTPKRASIRRKSVQQHSGAEQEILARECHVRIWLSDGKLVESPKAAIKVARNVGNDEVCLYLENLPGAKKTRRISLDYIKSNSLSTETDSSASGNVITLTIELTARKKPSIAERKLSVEATCDSPNETALRNVSEVLTKLAKKKMATSDIPIYSPATVKQTTVNTTTPSKLQQQSPLSNSTASPAVRTIDVYSSPGAEIDTQTQLPPSPMLTARTLPSSLKKPRALLSDTLLEPMPLTPLPLPESAKKKRVHIADTVSVAEIESNESGDSVRSIQSTNKRQRTALLNDLPRPNEIKSRALASRPEASNRLTVNRYSYPLPTWLDLDNVLSSPQRREMRRHSTETEFSNNSLRQKLTESQASRAAMTFTNIGNTCYMNAVLQALLHLQPLADTILSPTVAKLASNSTESVLKAVYDIFKQSAETKATAMPTVQSLSPKLLKDAISNHASLFKGNSQQDAHEFLVTVLDRLTQDFTAANRELHDQAEVNCPISQNFIGRLKHTFRCCNDPIEHVSATVESFGVLSIDIVAPNASATPSTEELLTAYLSDSEVNKRCDVCDTDVIHRASHEFESLPPILTIHLKRFQPTSTLNTTEMYEYRKLSNCVGINRTLQLSKHVSFSSKLQSVAVIRHHYQLAGVIHHIGYSAAAGHYITTVLDATSAQWLECDDERIRLISEELALTKERQRSGYIFFYVRQPE